MEANGYSFDAPKSDDGPKDAFDAASAQKFLQSRGYKSETPEDAAAYVKAMNAKDRKGFLKQLGEWVAAEGDGK